jgi:hypothetical protein
MVSSVYHQQLRSIITKRSAAAATLVARVFSRISTGLALCLERKYLGTRYFLSLRFLSHSGLVRVSTRGVTDVEYA